MGAGSMPVNKALATIPGNPKARMEHRRGANGQGKPQRDEDSVAFGMTDRCWHTAIMRKRVRGLSMIRQVEESSRHEKTPLGLQPVSGDFRRTKLRLKFAKDGIAHFGRRRVSLRL
jgi:hypothetical protein